jgi:hypothetical protein
MITLKQILQNRGYGYATIFRSRAEDIDFNNVEEICETLGYICRNIKHFDAEIPDTHIQLIRNIIPNYPIRNGTTSGGHGMKWASQFRIYLQTTRNCPQALLSRMQKDNQMRFTGSLFVEACFFVGFLPGYEQNNELIHAAINKIFPNESEQKAFMSGYRLSSI